MRGQGKKIVEELKEHNEFKNVHSLLKDYPEDYFLGVRKDCLEIYYCGHRVCKISVRKEKIVYETSHSYTRHLKAQYHKDSGNVEFTPKEFWTSIECIKKGIEDYVYGNYKQKDSTNGTLHMEKFCQQRIACINNNSEVSKWYYLDMEYIYDDGKKNEHPYGRADLIAISKNINENGKHDVAFIELKVGKGAYGASLTKNQKTLLDKIKNDKIGFYGESAKKLRLGSGLVSHVFDFMHFFSEPFYQKQIKKELVEILNTQNEFGLLDHAADLKAINEDQLSDKPNIYIVTCSGVPDCDEGKIKEKKLKQKYNDDYKSNDLCMLREAAKNALFGESIYSIKELSKDIENGRSDFAWILMNKDHWDVKEGTDIVHSMITKNKEFPMIFRFVLVSKKDDYSKCLPWPAASSG